MRPALAPCALLLAAASCLRAAQPSPTATSLPPTPEPTKVAAQDAPGVLKAGNQMLDESRWAEAAAYFQALGAQSSSKREAFRLNNLALAQLKLEQYEEARANAARAVELKKDEAAFWSNLAGAQQSLGKNEEALATYDSGIAALKAASLDAAHLEGRRADLQARLEGRAKERQRRRGLNLDLGSPTAAPASAPAASPAPKTP